jgi:hypothetical protein
MNELFSLHYNDFSVPIDIDLFYNSKLNELERSNYTSNEKTIIKCSLSLLKNSYYFGLANKSIVN